MKNNRNRTNSVNPADLETRFKQSFEMVNNNDEPVEATLKGTEILNNEENDDGGVKTQENKPPKLGEPIEVFLVSSGNVFGTFQKYVESVIKATRENGEMAVKFFRELSNYNKKNNKP